MENLCASPRSLPRIAEMGSQMVLILRLMKMVRDYADTRELEKVLQRDATLSCQLLRYLNSAGFGLQIEIQSLWSGSAPALADALFMTASQVNQAHGAAMVWAQDLNL